MSINIIDRMLEKLPGGEALLGVVDIKYKERLEANIDSPQQRVCFDGVAWNNGEGLAHCHLIPKTQNVREWLIGLCIL